MIKHISFVIYVCTDVHKLFVTEGLKMLLFFAMSYLLLFLYVLSCVFSLASVVLSYPVLIRIFGNTSAPVHHSMTLLVLSKFHLVPDYR